MLINSLLVLENFILSTGYLEISTPISLTSTPGIFNLAKSNLNSTLLAGA